MKNDDWDDDADEWDDDDWGDDDEPADTVPCPNCREPVYEDAVQCPACGEYIVRGGRGSTWEGKPMWWIVLAALGIIATIVALALT